MKSYKAGACLPIWILIIWSLLVNFAIANNHHRDAVTADFYEKALIASEQQRYDEANIHIRNLLRKSPSHLPGQLLYAQILLNKKMPAKAQAEFEKALSMGADEGHVIEYLATALFEQSKYQAVLELSTNQTPSTKSLKRYQLIRASAAYAIGDVDRAIEDLTQLALMSPTEPEIQLELISIYLDLNDLNNAEKKLNDVDSLAQNEAKFWYLKGRLSNLKQAYPTAIKYYQRSLQLDPQKSSLHKALANAYMAIGELGQASDAVEHALALSPNDPLAIYIQSEIFKQTDQHQASEKALDYISNRISLIDDRTKQLNPQLLLIDAMSSYSGGNWQQSVRKFNTYLENNPDDLDARVLLSQVYHQNNQAQDALRILKPVESQLLLNQEYAVVLAVAYMENGNTAAASRILQQRLRFDKQDTSAMLLLVKLTYGLQRFDDSLRYINALLKVEVNNQSAAFFRVELLQKLGRYSEALHSLDKAIAQYPPETLTPSSALILRVNLLHQLGQIPQRNAQLIQLYERWKAKPKRLMYLANLQHSVEFDVGAEQSYTQAARLAPNNESVLLAFAKWNMKQGDVERAEQLLSNISAQDVTQPSQYWALQGDIHVSRQAFKSAYDSYTQAVQGSGTDISTISKLARISRDINRANDATHLLKTLIERHPKRGFLVESLAEHLLESGAHQSAIFYYSKLLMSPLPLIKQAIALNNLAFLYTETSQYSLAIEHAKQALELRGDIPSFHDTLGWALTLSGQVAQGKIHLEKALSLAEDSAEIQAHLTYALNKLHTQALN